MSSSGVNVQDLEKTVSSIEHLKKQEKELSKEIKELYDEAKSKGYDVAALKKIITLRMSPKHGKDKLEQEITMFELYKGALGL